MCNLKTNVPKKTSMAFLNGSNYNHNFIIKKLEEFDGQFNCLGENTEKYITFTVPTEKEVIKVDKNGEKLKKKYHIDYNLLIALHLWQTLYQILLIIFLKEFIKLNANTDKMIKNMKLAELNIYIVTVFLDTQTLKITSV